MIGYEEKLDSKNAFWEQTEKSLSAFAWMVAWHRLDGTKAQHLSTPANIWAQSYHLTWAHGCTWLEGSTSMTFGVPLQPYKQGFTFKLDRLWPTRISWKRATTLKSLLKYSSYVDEDNYCKLVNVKKIAEEPAAHYCIQE